MCLSRIARAWDLIRRLYPKVVPAENPFAGMIRKGGKEDGVPATRDEACPLVAAIAKKGYPPPRARPTHLFRVPAET